MGQGFWDNDDMGREQFISELQAKVDYHKQQLAVWQAALDAELHPHAPTAKEKTDSKRTAQEIAPTAFIISAVTAAGIRAADIRDKARSAGLSYAERDDFPHKQLARLKRRGRVKYDDGKYFRQP